MEHPEAVHAPRISPSKPPSERSGGCEERYRALFDASPHPMILFDPASLRILEVNAAAVHLYGHDRARFRALRVTDLEVGTAHRDGVATHRRHDGSLVDVSVRSRVVTVGGRSANLLAAVDVSEIRRRDQQTADASKMEAVGQLAGGIAHHFNNLLSVVLGLAELVQTTLPPEKEEFEDMGEILQAGRRAAMLTQQLLAFSRKQPLEPRVLSPNTVVAGLEPSIRRVLGDGIECTIALHPQPGDVEVDPAQLEQVLLNLVLNARDAMPRGGTLTLGTSNVVLAGASSFELHLPSGPYVALSVTDTGTGMDAATRGRIFEPYFTTKDAGRGTGLGLFTVLGIVRQLGGAIAVRSEPNRGSSFHVYLPRVGSPDPRNA